MTDDSEFVEFSGCDYDGSTLRVGRFYFQNDFLLDDTIWPKRTEFLRWADRLFRQAKKQLQWSPNIQAYIGADAERFRRDGNRFVWHIRSDGQPVYADE